MIVVYRVALLSVAVVGLWALLDCRAGIRRAADAAEEVSGSVCPAGNGLLRYSLLGHGTSLVESVESLTEKLDSLDSTLSEVETHLSNIEIDMGTIDTFGVKIQRQ